MKNSLVSIFTIITFILFASSCNNVPSVNEAEFNEVLALIGQADSVRKVDGDISTAEIYIDSTLSKYNLIGLSLEQVQAIAESGRLYRFNALRKKLKPALERLSENDSLPGCEAAALLTINFPKPEEGYNADVQHKEWAEAYFKLVNHPAIGELILKEDYSSTTPFSRVMFMDVTKISDTGLLEEIARLLDMPMSDRAAMSTVQLFREMLNENSGISPERAQEIRLKVVKLAQNALDNVKAAGKDQAKRTLDYYNKNLAYLNGPTAKGELINYIAPEINFDWTNELKANKLSDLKGNVVILDFWATWCGPCIASFPNIRALQERYANYPVKIIGVTSLQGSHSDPINKKRIQVDTPEEEYALMPGFIEQMEMTWNVVFSPEGCFNPEFGVSGIPHVAIIDAEGKVRYNGLRPYNAPFHEAEKIDALLKEAGLPFPEQPMDSINYAKIGH